MKTLRALASARTRWLALRVGDCVVHLPRAKINEMIRAFRGKEIEVTLERIHFGVVPDAPLRNRQGTYISAPERERIRRTFEHAAELAGHEAGFEFGLVVRWKTGRINLRSRPLPPGEVT